MTDVSCFLESGKSLTVLGGTFERAGKLGEAVVSETGADVVEGSLSLVLPRSAPCQHLPNERQST